VRAEPEGGEPPALARFRGRGLPEDAWRRTAPLVQAGIPSGQFDVRQDPGNGDYWLTLAQRLSAVGLQDEAWRALERAERLNPDNPYNLAFRAELMRHGKDIPGAYAVSRRALELDPDDPVLRFLVGRFLIELGHPEEAIPYLIAAARGLAKRWDAQYLAGKALYDAERYPEAETHLLKAAALRPQHVDTAIKTAEIAWRLGRREESLERLRDFIRREPRETRPYLVLGDLLVILERDEEARAVWSTGLKETGGDPEIASRLRPRDGPASEPKG
jgi:tetratricopeptide (TPR) repeat protein